MNLSVVDKKIVLGKYIVKGDWAGKFDGSFPLHITPDGIVCYSEEEREFAERETGNTAELIPWTDAEIAAAKTEVSDFSYEKACAIVRGELNNDLNVLQKVEQLEQELASLKESLNTKVFA